MGNLQGLLPNLCNHNNSRIDDQEAEGNHPNKKKMTPYYFPELSQILDPDPMNKGGAKCSGGELCNIITTVNYNYSLGLSPKKTIGN